MNPQQLFDAGRLTDAIAAVTEELRNQPTRLDGRTLLFELLSFAGELDRAEKQLDVVGQQDVKADWAVQVYRNILAAERNRRRLWSDGLKPEFLLDPPSYIELHLQAINRLREGHPDEAKALLEKSADERPEVMASLSGQAAASFQDCDDVLAPVLEVIILRDYLWVPLEQIQELEVAKPERPRDLIWAPIRLVLADGSQRRGYMPVLYPGSHAHPDDQIKLGRATDWRESSGGPICGVGHKSFLCGDDIVGALELREVRFGS